MLVAPPTSRSRPSCAQSLTRVSPRSREVLVDRERAARIAETAADAPQVELVGRQRRLAQRQRDRVVDRRHVPARHGELELARARRLPEVLGHVVRRGSRQTRPGTCISCSGTAGSSGYSGSTDSTSSAPSLSRSTALISLVDLIADRLVVLRVLDHELAHDADAHALERLVAHLPSSTTKLAYGSFGISPFGIAVNMSPIRSP